MMLNKNKFALAAAITMTLMKTIKIFLWRPFCGHIPMLKGMMWRFHCGLGAKHFPGEIPSAGCRLGCPLLMLLIVFIMTFAAAWIFAWLYNKLVKGK
jgi:hypothetical protein